MNLKLLINLFVYSGSNFKAMRGLDTQIAMTVLQGVIKKEMSIQEVTVECREMKLKEVQEMFVRETGVSSWREAEKEFPAFATPEALDEFKKCPVKSMPQRYITRIESYTNISVGLA